MIPQFNNLNLIIENCNVLTLQRLRYMKWVEREGGGGWDSNRKDMNELRKAPVL
jgi:hypothetical protein